MLKSTEGSNLVPRFHPTPPNLKARTLRKDVEPCPKAEISGAIGLGVGFVLAAFGFGLEGETEFQ